MRKNEIHNDKSEDFMYQLIPRESKLNANSKLLIYKIIKSIQSMTAKTKVKKMESERFIALTVRFILNAP